MLGACEKSLRCADVVGVVHDVSNKWTKERIHQDVINMLCTVKNSPSFLILNKVSINVITWNIENYFHTCIWVIFKMFVIGWQIKL